MCFRTETFSLLRVADAHDQADQRPGDHAFRPGCIRARRGEDAGWRRRVFCHEVRLCSIRPLQRYLNPRRFGWARRVSSGQRRASGRFLKVSGRFLEVTAPWGSCGRLHEPLSSERFGSSFNPSSRQTLSRGRGRSVRQIPRLRRGRPQRGAGTTHFPAYGSDG